MGHWGRLGARCVAGSREGILILPVQAHWLDTLAMGQGTPGAPAMLLSPEKEPLDTACASPLAWYACGCTGSAGCTDGWLLAGPQTTPDDASTGCDTQAHLLVKTGPENYSALIERFEILPVQTTSERMKKK
jgi:hypothetical protein